MAHSAGPTSFSILLRIRTKNGKTLQLYRRQFKISGPASPRPIRGYTAASQQDCDACALKERCCPGQPRRKIPRSIHEAARDVVRSLAGTPEYRQSAASGKKIEMLFAHLKRILKLNRLRLRGPCVARDEFLLAGIAQNLRKLAKLVSLPPPDGVSQAIA